MELRADLIADGRFALRSDVEAQAVLDRIQEGDGLDDLIQDLRALSAFARQHEDALARIGAQPDVRTKLAEKIATELEQHLAGRRAGDRDEEAALDFRNRAATHLAEVMREIRATGAYVFRELREQILRGEPPTFPKADGPDGKATPIPQMPKQGTPASTTRYREVSAGACAYPRASGPGIGE